MGASVRACVWALAAGLLCGDGSAQPEESMVWAPGMMGGGGSGDEEGDAERIQVNRLDQALDDTLKSSPMGLQDAEQLMGDLWSSSSAPTSSITVGGEAQPYGAGGNFPGGIEQQLQQQQQLEGSRVFGSTRLAQQTPAAGGEATGGVEDEAAARMRSMAVTRQRIGSSSLIGKTAAALKDRIEHRLVETNLIRGDVDEATQRRTHDQLEKMLQTKLGVKVGFLQEIPGLELSKERPPAIAEFYKFWDKLMAIIFNDVLIWIFATLWEMIFALFIPCSIPLVNEFRVMMLALTTKLYEASITAWQPGGAEEGKMYGPKQLLFQALMWIFKVWDFSCNNLWAPVYTKDHERTPIEWYNDEDRIETWRDKAPRSLFALLCFIFWETAKNGKEG